MGHLDDHRRIPPVDWLQTALKAVRDDDALALPRPHLHERVMRAWEMHWRRRETQRHTTWWFAAAASVAFALTWASSQGRAGAGVGPSVAEERASVATLDGDVFLAPELLMDDAASIQYVRLSLAPRAMAAFGIPVVIPADDQPIAVEALIGLDGIPRAIRYAQFRQESQ